MRLEKGKQGSRFADIVPGRIGVLVMLSFLLLFSARVASADIQEDDSDIEAGDVAEESGDEPEAETETGVDAFLQATDCRPLFGTDRSHERNRERREKALQSVRGSRSLVTVVHHARWDDPVRLRIPGLEVLAIVPVKKRSYDLLVAVSPQVASNHQCEPGVYRLSQDDSLLPGVAILDVRRRFLLVDSRGVLTYIPVGVVGEIDFRMVWQSAWTIPRPTEEVTKPTRKRVRKARKSRRNRRRR
jgi:hypothetical protein